LTVTKRYARRHEIAFTARDDASIGGVAMTTTFDKREEGFEKQFAHDEELKFKATARRDRLFGLWAAQQMGLTGTAADDYAKSVVIAEIETHDVFGKVRKDFDAKGVVQTDDQIHKVMTELLARAVSEIKAGR
jgi:hypothetical protein